MFVILDSEAAVTLASDEAFGIGCRPATRDSWIQISENKLSKKKLKQLEKILLKDI